MKKIQSSKFKVQSSKSLRIPLSKALIWIFLSTVLITGSATLGWLYYLHLLKMRSDDDTYHIVSIVQTGPEREALKTVYLAELMNLSVDRPTNLYAFDPKDAQEQLLASPLIKEVRVKRIHPETVYVDYTTRRPQAFLADYENVLIDEEGYLFPCKPFLTPKKLPELYLGLGDFEEKQWQKPLEGKQYQLAKNILQELLPTLPKEIIVRKIDASNAYATSCGRREIVLILDDQVENSNDATSFSRQERILRLETKNYQKAIANYLVLREYLRDHQNFINNNPLVIDFRLPKLAFIGDTP